MTPEYRKQIELARGGQQLAGSKLSDEARFEELQRKERTGALTGSEPQELEIARKQRFQAAGKFDKKVQSKDVDQTDGRHLWTQYMSPDGNLEWRDEGLKAGPVSMTKGRPAFGKDAKGKIYSFLVDPKTNQPMPGTEDYNVLPSAAIKEGFPPPDTIRTGEFSWKDENGVLHRSATTSTTVHVPHAGAAGAGAGTGAAGSAYAAPAGEHKTAPGGTPSAPRPKGDRVIGATGPTGQTKSRADAGATVLQLLPNLRSLINDPEVKSSLGALPGRVSEAEMRIGNAPPKVRQLYGTLKSIYSMAGTMHGWRSLKVAEEFEKAYGGLHTDPDALLAGMDSMESTAKAMYETGYHHPYGQGTGASTGSGASSPHAVDKILDEIMPSK